MRGMLTKVLADILIEFRGFQWQRLSLTRYNDTNNFVAIPFVCGRVTRNRTQMKNEADQK